MDWLTTSTILQSLTDYADHRGWERLLRRFRMPIMRFGRKLGLSEADAEEAAQETLLAFAEAYRKGQYDRAKGRLSRWLFGIAYRQALAKRHSAIQRTARTLADGGSTISECVADESSMAQVWDRHWEESIVEICLERVRLQVEPATMSAFELVMREGLSPPKTAELLGTTVKAVYNAKYTVLTKLRAIKAEVEDAV